MSGRISSFGFCTVLQVLIFTQEPRPTTSNNVYVSIYPILATFQLSCTGTHPFVSVCSWNTHRNGDTKRPQTKSSKIDYITSLLVFSLLHTIVTMTNHTIRSFIEKAIGRHQVSESRMCPSILYSTSDREQDSHPSSLCSLTFSFHRLWCFRGPRPTCAPRRPSSRRPTLTDWTCSSSTWTPWGRMTPGRSSGSSSS